MIIDPGNYTGTQLKDAINSEFGNVYSANNPGVSFSLAGVMSCIYYYPTNTISFHLLGGGIKKYKAKVLTDYELTQTGRSFAKQSTSSIPSMNDVFRNYGVSMLFDELIGGTPRRYRTRSHRLVIGQQHHRPVAGSDAAVFLGSHGFTRSLHRAVA
jgi:hypothetical protein